MELSATRPEWHMPGRSDLSGTHEGVRAVKAFLSKMAERIGQIDIRPQDTMTSEKHIMVIHDARVIRGAHTYSLAGGFLFDVREVRVLKVFGFALDLYTLDELLAQ